MADKDIIWIDPNCSIKEENYVKNELNRKDIICTSEKIQLKKPSLIITTGGLKQEVIQYYERYEKSNFAENYIIFCGTPSYHLNIMKQYPNVLGVIKSLPELVELIQKYLSKGNYERIDRFELENKNKIGNSQLPYSNFLKRNLIKKKIFSIGPSIVFPKDFFERENEFLSAQFEDYLNKKAFSIYEISKISDFKEKIQKFKKTQKQEDEIEIYNYFTKPFKNLNDEYEYYDNLIKKDLYDLVKKNFGEGLDSYGKDLEILRNVYSISEILLNIIENGNYFESMANLFLEDKNLEGLFLFFSFFLFNFSFCGDVYTYKKEAYCCDVEFDNLKFDQIVKNNTFWKVSTEKPDGIKKPVRIILYHYKEYERDFPSYIVPFGKKTIIFSPFCLFRVESIGKEILLRQLYTPFSFSANVFSFYKDILNKNTKEPVVLYQHLDLIQSLVGIKHNLFYSEFLNFEYRKKKIEILMKILELVDNEEGKTINDEIIYLLQESYDYNKIIFDPETFQFNIKKKRITEFIIENNLSAFQMNNISTKMDILKKNYSDAGARLTKSKNNLKNLKDNLIDYKKETNSFYNFEIEMVNNNVKFKENHILNLDLVLYYKNEIEYYLFKNCQNEIIKRNCLLILEIINEVFFVESYEFCYWIMFIGNVYLRQKDFRNAYNIVDKYKVVLKENYPEEEFYCLFGTICYYDDKFQNAFENYKKLLVIKINLLGEKDLGVANLYFTLANICAEMNDKNNAAQYAKKTMEIYQASHKQTYEIEEWFKKL